MPYLEDWGEWGGKECFCGHVVLDLALSQGWR